MRSRSLSSANLIARFNRVTGAGVTTTEELNQYADHHPEVFALLGLATPKPLITPPAPYNLHTCLHGFKEELPAYREVRIFQMNCGEVTTSLSPRDFFLPAFVREWIDGALSGQDLDKWHSLDRRALAVARRADRMTRRGLWPDELTERWIFELREAFRTSGPES